MAQLMAGFRQWQSEQLDQTHSNMLDSTLFSLAGILRSSVSEKSSQAEMRAQSTGADLVWRVTARYYGKPISMISIVRCQHTNLALPCFTSIRRARRHGTTGMDIKKSKVKISPHGRSTELLDAHMYTELNTTF